MNSEEKKHTIDQESEIEFFLKNLQILAKISLKINFEMKVLSGENFSIFRNLFVKQKLKLIVNPSISFPSLYQR